MKYLFLILTFFLFISVRGQNTRIIGTWSVTDSVNDFTIKLEFRTDSTFIQTYSTKEIKQSGGKASHQQDKYYLKNDSTVVMISPAGGRKEVHIKFIGDNRMAYFKNRYELDSAHIFQRQ